MLFLSLITAVFAGHSNPTNILEGTEKNFNSLVNKENVSVVVEFGASWCGPCVSMKPILQKAASENQEDLYIVTIDVDQEYELGAQYNIDSIPTFILFEDGKPVYKFVGAMSERELKQFAKIK